ncbi:uncharacterized protein LOC142342602 [Convolutriloba macropyga]|uniref:uncharacterized protein LOC142342602 n=1 Tax=Convolutriloba macropyga TaxID=536237 RepID=UPI003F523E6F
MPKVSKLITAKLENYFNDTRLEQSFDVSSNRLRKGTAKDFLELQYEYLVEHVAEVENEKRKRYLREYRMTKRERDEKLLKELGKNDKKGEPADGDEGSSAETEGKGREERRGSENEVGDVPELDVRSNTSNKKSKKTQDSKSVKSMQSKRSAYNDTRSTTSKTSKGKMRILPELKVPVTSGKIKPKLVDYPRRKMTYSEADRIVQVANNLFRETENKQIDRIYRYREREHRILPPINESKDKKKTDDKDVSDQDDVDDDDDGAKKKTKVKKRETPMKFRLALHPGTVLKAPKLCQDVEKILEKSERRTLEEQEESSESEAESEYREPVDLEGNFKEPLPKGAGDCTHLSLLLGVVLDESDDTISQRTSSTSIQPTAIIEVDKQVEIEDEHVFPPPESQNSIISGQLKGQKERGKEKQQAEPVNEKEPELDFSQTESTSESESEEEQTKTPVATPEPNLDQKAAERILQKSESQKSKSSQNANEEVGESESDTDTAENEPEANQVEVDDDEKSKSVNLKHESEDRSGTSANSVKDSMSIKVSEQQDQKSQADETPVSSQVSLQAEGQKAQDRDDENESPLPNPSERETPFTEKIEADDETSQDVDDNDREARKMGKMSRRERDERHPSFQRSGGSTTTASSRRSSAEGEIELVPGNQERSSIAISVSPERQTPAVDNVEPKQNGSDHSQDPETKAEDQEPTSSNEIVNEMPKEANQPESEASVRLPKSNEVIESENFVQGEREEEPAQTNDIINVNKNNQKEQELTATDVKEFQELADVDAEKSRLSENEKPLSIHESDQKEFETENAAKLSGKENENVAEGMQENDLSLEKPQNDLNLRQNDSVSQKSEEQENLSFENKEGLTLGALETEEKGSFKLEDGIDGSQGSETEVKEAKNDLPNHLDEFFNNDGVNGAEEPTTTDEYPNAAKVAEEQKNDEIFGSASGAITVEADINKLDDGHQSEDVDQRNEELD